ncbi:hypothetical protein E1262_13035 [Jiangella aurantiaca]|uniref:DUF6571 domain-containing protein n=1 Tax=Jiangella aurantiaca TaxID=2530373 RepID=A0A4R5ADA2_9ACTN|nr:DUF6571 family protein [Jiangella aurantiaca]TDD69246.1 hypothetical protein E1262_13035 [Jiangella aurantiaca]
MAKAQIIVEEFRNLVTGVEYGKERLTEAKQGLTNALNRFDIDHDLGTQVQAAIDWADTELPGVRRRLSLAESLENSNPEWPAGSVELEETSISTVSPEEAQQNGEDAAQALIDSHGDIPQEVIDEILANANDPYFAAGLAQNLSPEQVASLLDTYDALGEARGDQNFATNESRRDLITGLGTVFGTATRNTGDLAMPAEYADQWSDAITAPVHEQGGEAMENQSQYLALLMSQGVYSRPFLNEVGDDLYAYENEGEDGAVWGPKSNHMDPVLDANGDPVIDVMATYMLALSNNPLAAQDFFSEGGTEEVDIEGTKMQINSRLQYFLHERSWNYDTDASNGGNLGLALEAATTTFRNGEYTGEISAQIASQTFTLVGDITGDDASGGFLGIGGSEGWQMWNGLRGPMADMLASYAPDLMRVARTGQADGALNNGWTVGPETELLGDGAPYGAAMNPALIQQILGTFGKDGQDEHLNTVLAGVGAASQWRMSQALDDALDDGTPPPAPVAMLLGQNVPELTTATNEMAATLGWVLNGAYRGALSEEELAQKQAEMRSQVFGALTSLPGLEPASEWGKFAFEQVTSQIEDAMGNVEGTASGDFSELSASEKEDLERMILNQMLASGYFDQEYIDAANQGGDRYGAPPPEAIKPGSNPPEFDFESEAYNTWLRDRFPMDSFLNTNVYPPFDEHLNAGAELAK